MKITFKDVGQGDSIVLEWQEDGHNKVGIIDCTKIKKRNPVLEHIRHKGYIEIDFIILSHPHEDHFSGMNQLFDYIEENRIIVKKFAHTLFILGSDFYKYLKWAEIDTAAMVDLKNLVKRFNVLREAGLIKKLEFISENWHQELMNGVVLKCLSPSHLEAEEYMKLVSHEPEKNKKKASSSANYLSTLFSLVIGEKYHLFTSDSESFTLKRLVTQSTNNDLLKRKLGIGQLPHHGSSKNHYLPFWDSLIKDEEKHAVISAGSNRTYKHPHLSVLQCFHENGYKIHCTNIVHGMGEFVEFIKKLNQTSSKLDTFSELIDDYTSGEKVFTLL